MDFTSPARLPAELEGGIVVTVQNIALWSFALLSIILFLFALLVLWKIYTNEISLKGLLAEVAPSDGTDGTPAGTVTTSTTTSSGAGGAVTQARGTTKPASYGKASLSRFQFLIFTFIIGGLYLLLSIEAGTFVEIPTNVLGLLGISGGSYLVSKAMSTPSKNVSANTDGQG